MENIIQNAIDVFLFIFLIIAIIITNSFVVEDNKEFRKMRRKELKDFQENFEREEN